MTASRLSSSSLFGTEIQQVTNQERQTRQIFTYVDICRIWAIKLEGIIIGMIEIPILKRFNYFEPLLL